MNYHSDMLSKAKESVELNDQLIEHLKLINGDHSANIDAYKKAIDLNHEIMDVHIEANAKLKDIVAKYGAE